LSIDSIKSSSKSPSAEPTSVAVGILNILGMNESQKNDDTTPGIAIKQRFQPYNTIIKSATNTAPSQARYAKKRYVMHPYPERSKGECRRDLSQLIAVEY
jgi:hypothetical protein